MRYGFDYITSGNYAGDWQELFFPVDSVVTLTTNKGDSFSGVTFSKGQSIVGPYEGISVTSGAVIAYKRSDTEKRLLFTGLLDTYGGAAAAYSLRRLSADYTGSAIRVRESATSTEADIGFDSFGNLDTTALLAHTGANDGYVVTWFDQSGNARNATQATAAAQPQIVSSGSVVLENGQAAIDFDVSTTTRLINATLSTSQPETSFAVIKHDTIGTDLNALYDSYNNVFHFIRGRSSNLYEMHSGTAFLSTIPVTTNQSLLYALHNGASSEIGKNNGTADIGDGGTNGFDGISIGNARGNPNPIVSGYNFKGKIQELILYASDQSSNRTAIESNINDFYSIYP